MSSVFKNVVGVVAECEIAVALVSECMLDTSHRDSGAKSFSNAAHSRIIFRFNTLLLELEKKKSFTAATIINGIKRAVVNVCEVETVGQMFAACVGSKVLGIQHLSSVAARKSNHSSCRIISIVLTYLDDLCGPDALQVLMSDAGLTSWAAIAPYATMTASDAMASDAMAKLKVRMMRSNADEFMHEFAHIRSRVQCSQYPILIMYPCRQRALSLQAWLSPSLYQRMCSLLLDAEDNDEPPYVDIDDENENENQPEIVSRTVTVPTAGAPN